MNNLIFVLFRRLRAPLITLIVVYAVAILGFVLIPGADDQGRPWRMDFFHAFYFVSFMGSTIGFGEIPYPFTDGQRMWATFTIYASVIAWLYGIGKVLALFQDQSFIRLVERARFRNRVARWREPFYLVCGYGMTGSLVVRELTRRGSYSVVVDIDQTRIDALETDDLMLSIPGLCADAALPDVLQDAGLQNPGCLGVLALTDDDQANLAIAIASKLLAPGVTVICRSAGDATTANLASFGTDHIIDPFVTYAEYLALALHAPWQHLVHDWLTNPRHRRLESARRKVDGRWVICGYGRFGKAIRRAFGRHGVTMTFIDLREPTDDLVDYVVGAGTEAETLEEARIRDAVGLVAGTDNDANNLSIVMTALELKPDLFTVVRQNRGSNRMVFEAARPELIMEPAAIIANNILSLIKTPLLNRFLALMLRESEEWARGLVNRMSNIAGDRPLDVWAVRIGSQDTPAVQDALDRGATVALRVLMTDPRDHDERLPAICLLWQHGSDPLLLPHPDTRLHSGDKLLFCGIPEALREMRWIFDNDNVLARLLGELRPYGGRRFGRLMRLGRER